MSRMTVRQAIQGLVDDTILQRRVGAGTYIAEKKMTEHLEAVTSFTNLMMHEGKTHHHGLFRMVSGPRAYKNGRPCNYLKIVM